MIEITILVVVNIALIGVIVANWKKSKLNFVLPGLSKYIFMFLTGWLGFTILFSLHILFDDLESGKTLSYELLLRLIATALSLLAMGWVITISLIWLPTKF
jgi:hypothetical protein